MSTETIDQSLLSLGTAIDKICTQNNRLREALNDAQRVILAAFPQECESEECSADEGDLCRLDICNDAGCIVLHQKHIRAALATKGTP